MMPGSFMYNPWSWKEPEPVRGTRVWRAYFRDRPSFTFGLYVGDDATAAYNHATQWGDVLSVEAVT